MIGYSENEDMTGMKLDDMAKLVSTQELTIAELWQAGIRAFDLRPCTREGYLNINHGIISTALRFDTALQTLKDSLEANPSECAIIHLLE